MEEEIALLRKEIEVLGGKVRYYERVIKPEDSKMKFGATEKLMIIEGVLSSVVGTEIHDHITRMILMKINDDDFWRKLQHSNIKRIIGALSQLGLN